MKALLLSHGSFQYGAILDSGANANILPTSYLSSVNNLVRTSGTLTIGDNSSIPTFAIANYGILDRVILSHTIACALISVSYLTSKLNLYVFYSYERAFIMQSVLPKVTDNSVALSATYRIVATATLLNVTENVTVYYLIVFYCKTFKAFLFLLRQCVDDRLTDNQSVVLWY